MIRRTEKRLTLCCLLLTALLIFIWGNSFLPGEISAAFSQWVKELLAKLFPGSGPGGMGHGLLRKLAHFTEFAGLGVCLCWLWGMLANNTAHTLLPALGCGFAVACVDETIQRFVPGRCGCFTDVMIDFSGVCLGVSALAISIHLYTKKQNNNFGGKTK